MVRFLLAWAGISLLGAAPLMTLAEHGTPKSSSQLQTQLQESPLVPHMKALNGGQRSLKKLIADPAATETALLEQLTAMEDAAHALLTLAPPSPEKPVEGDRRVWVNEYKKTLVEVYVLVLDLNNAAVRRDAEALASGYEKLAALKKLGHEQFRD